MRFGSYQSAIGSCKNLEIDNSDETTHVEREGKWTKDKALL